jgi:hypothetical protein
MRGESKMRWYWIASVIVLLTTSVSADERGANADLVKVGSFLNKTFPKKKWQTGPTRIDTPEIRKAYPGARFYAVKSVPPLPPGAALPKLIEAYQQKMREYREPALSATVRIELEDAMTTIQKPADYNVGLAKVDSEESAQLAAAAILALDSKGTRVSANQVRVRSLNRQWVCQAMIPRVMQGNATFDSEGKCLNVRTVLIRLFPPSAPPASAPPRIPR